MKKKFLETIFAVLFFALVWWFLFLLLLENVHAYQMFGTTGSVMSKMSQPQRDTLTPLTPGVMVYNDTSRTYEVWDGISWGGIGAGGGGGFVSRNWYYASGISGNSANNTAIPHFTVPQAGNNMNSAECGTMVNDGNNGIFLTVAANAFISVTLNTYNLGPAYVMGISRNPTVAELDTSFLNIPVDKQGCKIETLGTTSNAQSCTVSYMAVPGDTIYVHGTVGQVWANPGQFSVRYTCMADMGFVGGSVRGPISTNLGRVAIWNDLTGTLLDQTGWTIPRTVGTPGQILTTDGIDTATWQNSPVSLPADGGITNLVLMSNGTGTGQYLGAGGIGQILTQSAANAITWENPAPTITTPVVTAVNRIALWGDLVGDTLIETPYTIPTTACAQDEILKADATGNFVCAADASTVNAVTKTTAFTGANRIALSGGADRTLAETAYVIPATSGTVGQVLKTTAADTVTWADDEGKYIVYTDVPTAGGQIALTNKGLQTHKLNPATAVTLDTAPFSGGPFEDGIEIDLVGLSDTNTTTILYADIAGGCLLFGDATLGKGDILKLKYFLTENRFYEISRSF